MHGSNDKILKMLLAHGADPDAKNRDGKTARELARKSGKKRIVEALAP